MAQKPQKEYIPGSDPITYFFVQPTAPRSFRQSVRDYVIAFYQTQRNAFVVIITLVIAFYVLTVPDQAADMIHAVIDTGVWSRLFQYILLSTFVWSWVVYGSTRLILHISPVGIRINRAADQLLRWLPKLGGIIPGIILAYAFWQPKRWQPYLLLLESSLMLALFFWLENRVAIFRLPAKWHFPNHYTGLWQDFRLLWRHPMGGLVLKSGFVLTAFLLLLFSLPVEWEIARRLRPTAVVIFGITLYTFWGSVLVYFNDYRYRPLVLVVGLYLIAISTLNDNTAVRQAKGPASLTARPTIEDHFRNWINVRRSRPNDTIPIMLVAAEGGGIRALNWTAETLIRLDSIVPGFNRHVYALSGVSGGGVGTVFYTAFLRDVPDARRMKQFGPFRKVIRDDYLSAVSAALLFPEFIQGLLPFPVARLERTKWLEDSWADSYHDNLGLPTLNESLTQLYQAPNGYNYALPSLLLNGTLAESGQKVITSNLKLDPRYFKDVVSTLDVLGADVPLKTAASLCSRFPVVTNGGLIQKDSLVQGQRQHYGGHVVDGGYFDNSGVETCFQLLNNLVPLIQELDRAEPGRRVHVVPYVLFIQNSNTIGQLPHKQSVLQVIQIPLLAFFNAWNNGSVTRDNMFNSFMDRFANPVVTYLTIRLAYNDRYPLGWFLSDSVARNLSKQATDSINLSIPALRQLRQTFRPMAIRPPTP